MFIVAFILPWNERSRYNDYTSFTNEAIYRFTCCIILKFGPDIFTNSKVCAKKHWLLPSTLQEYLFTKYIVMPNVKTNGE